MMRALVAALCLACTAPHGVRAFEDSSKAAVEATVNDFMYVFDTGDWAALPVPPGLIAYIAYANGLKPEQVRARMNLEMDQLMQRVELVSADVDWSTMRTGTTTSGIDYAFLTFRSEFVLDGRTRKTASMNIVTEVDGDWYVVRIGSPQNWQLFQRAYPQFKHVEYPG